MNTEGLGDFFLKLGKRLKGRELEANAPEGPRDLSPERGLKLEREELSILMGAIWDAILAVNLNGSPLFFNSRFSLLFGNEAQLRKPSIRLWEMFRDPEILEAFKSALQQGRTSSTQGIPIQQITGARQYFALSVSPLRKPTGEVYGAVGIFHDVTELKRAEQIRIDFVANVSHELRTPLTSIKGYTDTLIEDAKAGRAADPAFLETIARNTDRLMNLIRDLLDLSSLESPEAGTVLQKTRLSTEEATAKILKQLEGAFASKNQSAVVRAETSHVNADPGRLEQVLVNLLDNAHKYTPAGGTIQVIWQDDDRGTLLKVKDDGPGIPLEHQARLFERFYRVDKARSREQGGTGLGLAIVKHIMQRHQGTAWVESKPGEGATFVCRFPS